MKRMNQFTSLKRAFFAIALLISTALISCKKETTNNPASNPSLAVPADADGFLRASRTSSDGSTATLNVAQAGFSNTPGVTSNFVDVGVVKCNTVSLTKLVNNTYNAPALSLDFSAGNLQFQIDGGNSFGAFNRTGLTFPLMPNITSTANVTKSGFTITNTSASGANVLLYSITQTGSTTPISKWASSGTATSITFSASELSSLTVGATVGIGVSAYKITTETLGGRKIYMQIGSVAIKTHGTVS